MATQRFGSAEFTYTDGTAQTHTLAVPLQKVRPSVRFGGKWDRESLDLTNKETWYSGIAYEIVAVIRYDDTPQSLIDLLLAGAKNITVTYDDGDGNTYQCKMIGLPNVITPNFDEEQKALDEHTIEITLRKTNQTAFDSAIF